MDNIDERIFERSQEVLKELEKKSFDNIPTKSVPVPVVSNNEKDSNTGSKTIRVLTYQSWKKVIKNNFPSLVLPAELCLSMFGQLLIKDIVNPCAVVLVDVPSAGKTIVLNMFSGLTQTYTTDNFTPSAFVSQAANVKKDKLAEVDLLPKIKDKVLIVRDLAPIFGQRDDDLLRSMGVLTRVMDGEGLQLDAGVHGSRGYSGDFNFMFLAGSTPIQPRIFKLMGNLGSRLLFLNTQSKTKDEDSLVEQLISSSWREKQKRCTEASRSFIEELFNKYPERLEWNKSEDSKETIKLISRSAILLARLRGSINVWKENSSDGVEYSFQEPVIEQPDRVNQILYNLARGHALVCGRTQINNDDVKVVLNIAFDSAPGTRTKLFRLLASNAGNATTEEVIVFLNCSATTADKEMEKLKILGIVDITSDISESPGRPSKIIKLCKKFEWFFSDECLDLLGLKGKNNRQEHVVKQKEIFDFPDEIYIPQLPKIKTDLEKLSLEELELAQNEYSKWIENCPASGRTSPEFDLVMEQQRQILAEIARGEESNANS